MKKAIVPVYAGAAVNLDVEDVVDTFGDDVHVQAMSQTQYLLVQNGNHAPLHHVISQQIQSENASVGIFIANGRSACVCIDSNRNLAFVDSHKHREHGAMVLMARHQNLDNFVQEFLASFTRFWGQAVQQCSFTCIEYNL